MFSPSISSFYSFVKVCLIMDSEAVVIAIYGLRDRVS